MNRVFEVKLVDCESGACETYQQRALNEDEAAELALQGIRNMSENVEVIDVTEIFDEPDRED